MAEWAHDDYTITDDRARVDIDVVWGFLRQSYWALDRPRDVVEQSIDHSVPFSLFDGGGAQVGFLRVVTDFTTFAWIADVFVIEPHRGRGCAQALVRAALSHPQLRGLRRWLLGTSDAHPVYAGCGFTPLAQPEVFMELRSPDRDPAASA